MADLIIASQADFLAFIRDQAMANGNLSIRGAARCCGVDESTVREALLALRGALATSLASQGFDPRGFAEEGMPPQAVWLCIEYYAFESKAKAPMARQLARTFGAIGVMTALKELSAPAPIAPQNGPSKQLVAAREIREITDLLDDNPRLAQVLIDSVINDVIGQHQLTGSTEQLRGVAEIATEMGFAITASNRVKLGKFIVAQGFSPKKEKRLCNGVSTEINCYPDTPGLRTAISLFFEN